MAKRKKLRSSYKGRILPRDIAADTAFFREILAQYVQLTAKSEYVLDYAPPEYEGRYADVYFPKEKVALSFCDIQDNELSAKSIGMLPDKSKLSEKIVTIFVGSLRYEHLSKCVPNLLGNRSGNSTAIKELDRSLSKRLVIGIEENVFGRWKQAKPVGEEEQDEPEEPEENEIAEDIDEDFVGDGVDDPD